MHGHFLPGMDDGCKTVEESLRVLKSSYAQGIHRMFATPHYYPVESVDTFLERRERAAAALERRMTLERAPLPQVCLGAEVAYRSGIDYEEDLEKLCLGSSRYLLLELPFSKWSSEVARGIQNICSRGITPVLAHIERYLDIQSRSAVGEILELKVLVQMNGETLLRPSTRRKGRKLLKDGVVQLLGSDCHNMTTRPPNLGEALAYLREKRMDDILEQIAADSQVIFTEAAEG